MREVNKIAESLFEKIRDRFEDVSLGDENAKATQNPENARFFNFDYVVDEQNHGNITLSLIDETSLKVYFSKNISSKLEGDDRKKWYAFLRELREFAKRNLLSFEPRDITRSTLKHRDVQQVSKADSTYTKNEVIGESRMHGTSRSSYQECGPVKLIVRHSGQVNPELRGDRSRKIRAIYVETAEGERFKLPHNNLRYARAMACHVSEGGALMDDFGQHITRIAEECGKLRPFKSSMRSRTFEDQETQAMVEAAFEYHGLLNNTLKRIGGRKGYAACKESFHADETLLDDFDVDSLRERFVKRSYNERMEDALPIVHKAYEMKKSNKFAQQFESWANNVAEGTWNKPQGEKEVADLIDLLSEPLALGVDAQNATSALYNLLGDDVLFDQLEQLAEEDPEADARDVIMAWLEENMPEVYQKLTAEISDEDTADQYESAVAEGDDEMEFDRDLDEPDQEYGSDMEFDQDRDNPDQFNRGMSEGEYDEDQVESIQTAIIRRITQNIGQHQELLMKAGPDGVMNAARDVASFHAPVEELGSSDVSIMVREVYREVGVEYPEMNEVKDTIKYDPKTGKLTGWEHESDWQPAQGKDPRGKVTHSSDVARRKSEELANAELDEGKMKEVDMDLTELSDEEFQAKYGKSKEEMKAALAEGYEDHVNKDEKLKRMGAKELSPLDKLKMMPGQMKAMARGDSEDDLVNYNKQFNEEIAQMRRIAGLK